MFEKQKLKELLEDVKCEVTLETVLDELGPLANREFSKDRREHHYDFMVSGRDYSLDYEIRTPGNIKITKKVSLFGIRDINKTVFKGTYYPVNNMEPWYGVSADGKDIVAKELYIRLTQPK